MAGGGWWRVWPPRAYACARERNKDGGATPTTQITPADIAAVGKGTPADWPRDTIQLARRDAYALPDQPTCNDHRSVALSDAYVATAENDAAIQLKKAAIRLAVTLNRALG